MDYAATVAVTDIYVRLPLAEQRLMHSFRKDMQSARSLLLLCSLVVCTLPAVCGHADLLLGQDKDNWYPWEKLLSAQEMLVAQRDEPSPTWLHAFQALDSFAPVIRGSHTALFNVTTPILPALASLYSPATMLLLTPYDITFASPHRTVRQLAIQQLRHSTAQHFHSVGLFVAATSHTADRRSEDRASLQLMEQVLTSSATVLVLQLWSGQRMEWWGDLLLPTGWSIEASWGWERVATGRDRGGWRLDERWRDADDVMTVWQVRVRADVETAEWTEKSEAVHRGVSDARGVWQRVVEDRASAGQNVTWLPYRRVNRL